MANPVIPPGSTPAIEPKSRERPSPPAQFLLTMIRVNMRERARQEIKLEIAPTIRIMWIACTPRLPKLEPQYAPAVVPSSVIVTIAAFSLFFDIRGAPHMTQNLLPCKLT